MRTATPIAAAFVKYLTSPRAASLFRQRGMLPAAGAWPEVSGPSPGPEPAPGPEPEPAPEPELLGP